MDILPGRGQKGLRRHGVATRPLHTNRSLLSNGLASIMSEFNLVCWACVYFCLITYIICFFRCYNTIVFTTAMVRVFLLNSASSSTALGLLNLIYSMNCVALLVDDFHGKFGLEQGGLLINNALYSVIAFGNLLNQEWATLANNVGAPCICSMFISTGKFKEVSTITRQF